MQKPKLQPGNKYRSGGGNSTRRARLWISALVICFGLFAQVARAQEDHILPPKSAGHQVRLITFESFASLVAENNLDFHPVQGDAQALVANGGADMLGLMRSFRSLAEGYARDLSAPQLGETDLIINQLPAGLYGFDLAEKYGVPLAQAAVIPLARTNTFPLMGFPKLSLPGYNKATYYLGEQMAWQMFRAVINRWR